MLIHDNNKVSVLSNNRCGHQSMCDYFNLPKDIITKNTDHSLSVGEIERRQIHKWAASTSKKVLVLRNPIERMWSGIRLYDMYVKPVIALYDAAKLKGIDRSDAINQFRFAGLFADEATRHENIQTIIFHCHCAPFLNEVVKATSDFYILDFNKLDEYIPVTPRTNITNCDIRTLDNFIENDIFTKEDMENEYQTYLDIKNTKPEISPAEWKESTILN